MHIFQNIAPALINSLWQAAIGYIVLYFLRRSKYTKPNFTYVVGMLLQVLLTFDFFYSIFHTDNEISNTLNFPHFKISENNNTNYYISISYILLFIINFFIRYYKNRSYNNSLLDENSAELSHSLRSEMKELQEKLHIKRPVQLFIKDNIVGPFTKGVLKPSILIPTTLLTGLNKEQLRAVLLHELSHIKRYDYLWLLLQTVMERLLYFNPFFLLISNAINEDRELACDLKSIYINNYNSINYTELLLLISKNIQQSSIPVLNVAGTKKSELFNRAAYLLEQKKNRHFEGKTWMSAVAIGAFVWGLNNMPQSQNLKISSSPTLAFAKEMDTTINMPLAIKDPTSSKTKAAPNITQKPLSSDKQIVSKNTKPEIKREKVEKSTTSSTKDLVQNRDKKPIKQSTITSNTDLFNPDVNNKVEWIPLSSNDPNTRAFALAVKNPEQQEKAYQKLINNIQQHFNIHSASYQFASFVSANDVKERNSMILQSDKFNFLISKQDNTIRLYISSNTENIN